MFHVKHGFRLHLVTELAFRLRRVGLRCAIEGTIQRVTSPPKLLPAAAPRQHEELRRLIHVDFDTTASNLGSAGSSPESSTYPTRHSLLWWSGIGQTGNQGRAAFQYANPCRLRADTATTNECTRSNERRAASCASQLQLTLENSPFELSPTGTISCCRAKALPVLAIARLALVVAQSAPAWWSGCCPVASDGTPLYTHRAAATPCRALFATRGLRGTVLEVCRGSGRAEASGPWLSHATAWRETIVVPRNQRPPHPAAPCGRKWDEYRCTAIRGGSPNPARGGYLGPTVPLRTPGRLRQLPDHTCDCPTICATFNPESWPGISAGSLRHQVLAARVLNVHAQLDSTATGIRATRGRISVRAARSVARLKPGTRVLSEPTNPPTC